MPGLSKKLGRSGEGMRKRRKRRIKTKKEKITESRKKSQKRKRFALQLMKTSNYRDNLLKALASHTFVLVYMQEFGYYRPNAKMAALILFLCSHLKKPH